MSFDIIAGIILVGLIALLYISSEYIIPNYRKKTLPKYREWEKKHKIISHFLFFGPFKSIVLYLIIILILIFNPTDTYIVIFLVGLIATMYIFSEFIIPNYNKYIRKIKIIHYPLSFIGFLFCIFSLVAFILARGPNINIFDYL